MNPAHLPTWIPGLISKSSIPHARSPWNPDHYINDRCWNMLESDLSGQAIQNQITWTLRFVPPLDLVFGPLLQARPPCRIRDATRDRRRVRRVRRVGRSGEEDHRGPPLRGGPEAIGSVSSGCEVWRVVSDEETDTSLGMSFIGFSVTVCLFLDISRPT